MAAWAKAALVITVVALPGGLLALCAYAVARAVWQQLRTGPKGQRVAAAVWSAVRSVRPADVFREARSMSGLHAVPASR